MDGQGYVSRNIKFGIPHLGMPSYENSLNDEDKNGFMPVIFRESNNPYEWSIGEAPISAIANKEKEVKTEAKRQQELIQKLMNLKIFYTQIY